MSISTINSDFKLLTTTVDFDYTDTSNQTINLTPPVTGYVAIGVYQSQLKNKTRAYTFMLRNDNFSNGWMLEVENTDNQSGYRCRGSATIIWAKYNQ